MVLTISIIACTPSVKISDKKRDEIDNTNYFSEPLGTDRITLIEDTTDALSSRIQMIRNSKETLDIALYKIKNTDLSRMYLSEIIDAADRGVKVRFLIDGNCIFFNSEVDKMMEIIQKNPNIEVKVYNPVNILEPWKIQFIMHDKFMISDMKYLILGGRNIDDRHYNPSGYDGKITNDRDVLVWKTDNCDKSSINQTKLYFDSLWEESATKRVKSKEKYDLKKTQYHNIKLEFISKNPKFYKKSFNDYLNSTVKTNKITLITNPIEPYKKEPWVAYHIKNICKNAKNKVEIQTPYMTKNPDILKLFTDLNDEKEVEIITNSLASSPNYPAFSNYVGSKKEFLSTGSTIYEFQSEDSIHAKSLRIDSNLSLVGSFNFDDRSVYLDTETMLVIDSEEFSEVLNDAFNTIKAKSLKVNLNGEYEKSDNIVETETPLLKRLATILIYLLLYPFRFLL